MQEKRGIEKEKEEVKLSLVSEDIVWGYGGGGGGVVNT
jgi:hypothetical protein